MRRWWSPDGGLSDPEQGQTEPSRAEQAERRESGWVSVDGGAAALRSDPDYPEEQNHTWGLYLSGLLHALTAPDCSFFSERRTRRRRRRRKKSSSGACATVDLKSLIGLFCAFTSRWVQRGEDGGGRGGGIGVQGCGGGAPGPGCRSRGSGVVLEVEEVGGVCVDVWGENAFASAPHHRRFAPIRVEISAFSCLSTRRVGVRQRDRVGVDTPGRAGGCPPLPWLVCEESSAWVSAAGFALFAHSARKRRVKSVCERNVCFSARWGRWRGKRRRGGGGGGVWEVARLQTRIH